jgi:XTP/dITP diphosphohydrolase
MPKEILLVTSSQHKIKEFQEIFSQVLPRLQLLTLLDLPKLEHEVDETGASYKANALLKAQSYARLTPLPIVADDSGVRVAAFPKLLGIASHRWQAGSDEDRLYALLAKLKGVSNRHLTYQSTLCYLAQNQSPQFFTGLLRGMAALQPRGNHGFGYDPIMIPQGYRETLAQMGDNLKNQISHRRRAINKLARFLISNG